MTSHRAGAIYLKLTLWTHRAALINATTSHTKKLVLTNDALCDFIRTAYGRYPIKFILPEFVSYLGGKRGAVCGERFTFLYTSPYEHVQYNVSGPYVKYFCL